MKRKNKNKRTNRAQKQETTTTTTTTTKKKSIAKARHKLTDSTNTRMRKKRTQQKRGNCTATSNLVAFVQQTPLPNKHHVRTTPMRMRPIASTRARVQATTKCDEDTARASRTHQWLTITARANAANGLLRHSSALRRKKTSWTLSLRSINCATSRSNA